MMIIIGIIILLLRVDCSCGQSQFLVTDLPGIPESYTAPQYAGLIQVDAANDGNLFFWLFESVQNDSTDPVVIWLNGGPGCSSVSSGVFLEVGPFKVQDDGLTLVENPYSWSQIANLLVVDQPVGVGFSYTHNGAYTVDEAAVDAHFLAFLQRWFEFFPRFASRDLYIFGESWAGRYIVSMANTILQNDKSIRLVGVGIGNGWVSPVHQYPAYSEYAYGVGIIGYGQYQSIQRLYQSCLPAIQKGMLDPPECNNVYTDAYNWSGSVTSVNLFDVRYYDTAAGQEEWPPGLHNIYTYLNRADVQAALHVPPEYLFEDCNNTVYDVLSAEDATDSGFMVPGLLSQIRMLFYSGQFDLVVNHLGTTNFLENLPWPGLDAYKAAPRYVWNVGNTTAGYVQSHEPLTWIVVIGASHMVPYDVPMQSFDMLRRFMAGESFNDWLQQIPEYAPLVVDDTVVPPEPTMVPLQTVYIASACSLLAGLVIAVVAYKCYALYASYSARHRYQALDTARDGDLRAGETNKPRGDSTAVAPAS